MLSYPGPKLILTLRQVGGCLHLTKSNEVVPCKVVKAPFLTQKVPGKIRDIIIGQNFIIALKEDRSSAFQISSGCFCQTKPHASLAVQESPSRNSILFKCFELPWPHKDVVDSIAPLQDGSLVSWGEDKVGCLGLGTEQVNVTQPNSAQFAHLRRFFATAVLAPCGFRNLVRGARP